MTITPRDASEPDPILARREALDIVLEAVADSPWREHLMLRGSILLRGWLGLDAREPGDVDFVVLPQGWAFHSERTETMLRDIAERVATAAERSESIRIQASEVDYSEIWTYDRVPGRRLNLRWTALDARIRSGNAQADFVFNEPLPQPPQWTEIPRLGAPGAPVRLLAASPELSLAWKVRWLTEDRYPEGKDLYDAVLLAERFGPDAQLLRTVSPETWFHELPELTAAVDWDELIWSRPELTGQLDAFAWRLILALAPVFPDQLADFRTRLGRTLDWTVKEARRRTEKDRDEILLEDGLERWAELTTVQRLLAVQAEYGCDLAVAAERIAVARQRNQQIPGIEHRVDPYLVADTVERWSDSSAGNAGG
ncbi:hypothetical protein JMUB6875_33060 [Nocardia sp. JMUB6875]|uniref:nucleotidyl transferase AbiEii/AbiGii toxin family protein n=1 Tax=Nocardia sp. JMUB6875 TaxID=3158170 RepID=UPI0032E73AA1